MDRWDRTENGEYESEVINAGLQNGMEWDEVKGGDKRKTKAKTNG